MTRRLIALIMALGMVLTVATPALGYELLGLQLREGRAINGKICFGANIPEGLEDAIIEGARDYKVEMEEVAFIADKGDCAGLTMGTDAYVKFRWDTTDPSCGPLAYAIHKGVDGNGFSDWVEISIVKDCWDAGLIDTSLPVGSNQMDAYTMAVHEYGHALGLGHFGTGAMNATIPLGVRHGVGPEMEDGIRAVYGW